MYDIESFITRYFTDFRYYGNPPTDISICCPFCEERGSGVDNKYHLQVSMDPDHQVVHCFRCGYAANWVQFVINVTGLPYVRAIGELYVTPRVRSDMQNYIKGKVYERACSDSISKEYNLPGDFRLLGKERDRLDQLARKYLLKRGFGKEVWGKYKLGVSDELGYRLIIPIEQGYWQGRALLNWVQPKYINPKDTARDILFNARALEMYDEVVVCEGFFSAIAVGDNAIALIGKEPTTEKVKRILKSQAESFIIALEAGAFSTMGRLADALIRSGKRVTLWGYETGDPADTQQHTTIPYGLKAKLSILLEK